MIATHNGWSLMCPCMLSLNTLLESTTFMMTSRRKTMLRKRREFGGSKTNGHNINSLIRAEDEGSSQQDRTFKRRGRRKFARVMRPHDVRRLLGRKTRKQRAADGQSTERSDTVGTTMIFRKAKPDSGRR